MLNFIKHDGGRSLSKRKKQSNDCVIRAICIAFGRNYDEVYDEFSRMGRECGRGTAKKIWQEYLNKRAKKLSFPAIAGQKRMNPITFCQNYSKGKYIIQFAGHLSSVIDGVIYDDFKIDSSKCIYSAWKIG